jgi:hypothetical protein
MDQSINDNATGTAATFMWHRNMVKRTKRKASGISLEIIHRDARTGVRRTGRADKIAVSIFFSGLQHCGNCIAGPNVALFV